MTEAERVAAGLRVTRRVVADPVVVTMPGGKRRATEREIVRCDDWRDTPFGLVNFGWVYIGPSRAILEAGGSHDG